MNIPEKPMEGWFLVVNANQLFDYTRDGWALIAVLDETVDIGERTEIVTLPAGEMFDHRGNYIGKRHNEEKREVKRVEYGHGHRFLVSKPENAVRAQLNAENDKLSRELRETGEKLSAREREFEKLQKQFSDKQTEADRAHAATSTAHASLRAERERVRKMESDIAAIRREFGEAAFNKALADHKKREESI